MLFWILKWKKNNLKERSYSFYESLYEKFHWIKLNKHKCFNKEYETHPLREPSPQRDILIMIDGTPHDWFQNGKKLSLHIAIDDATGELLCSWLMPTECLEGYVHMLEILVTKYGIPENFYSDKHTILISLKDGNLTNFGHMCEDLGINIIAANTPQAKGKVEKWNNTIQNRLINDIKRYNIKSIDELNIFLTIIIVIILIKNMLMNLKKKKQHLYPWIILIYLIFFVSEIQKQYLMVIWFLGIIIITKY